MIDLSRIDRQVLHSEPWQWASIDGLFSAPSAAALAASFPLDRFKRVKSYGVEKGQDYETRSLIRMGGGQPSFADSLSPEWRQFAEGLLSPDYRAAMSRLTGLDLSTLPIEVNVHHYGPGHWLGPHVDMQEKVVSHILYFNEDWNEADGGCLQILRSSDMKDVAATVLPLVGNSAVIVRSEGSWHAVSHVAEGCRRSRRSMTVTFYRPGSVSPMWPPGESPLLQDHRDPDEGLPSTRNLDDPEAADFALRETNAALVKRDWRILELEALLQQRDQRILELEGQLQAANRRLSARVGRALRSVARRLWPGA